MTIYDRADRIADRIQNGLIVFAVAVLLFNILRAAIHFDAWKWMVQ